VDAPPRRIAMIAPPWFDVPPDGYGGIEEMAADLIDELVTRGHEVILLCTGGNGTKATSIDVGDRPDPGQLRQALPEIVYAARVAKALRPVRADVVHDHSQAGPLLAHGRAAPTVLTAHGPVTAPFDDYYRSLGDAVRLVAISAAQRRTAPDLNWAGVVHNAVRADRFPFSAGKEDYLLFLGRLSPDKQAHVAIDAARAAGHRIVLAAKSTEPEEQEYFEREVQPRLGEDTHWFGEADAEQKKRLLAGARCLLFPIDWEEPFGMVMIEANACGTPVVALRRGAVPEVIEDGVNGFGCEHPDQLPDAIRRAATLDPARCRDHLRGRFDPETMARGYEAVYERAIAAGAVPPET
jgi:glycosyltransferase involved in cell wall biosynthesis